MPILTLYSLRAHNEAHNEFEFEAHNEYTEILTYLKMTQTQRNI